MVAIDITNLTAPIWDIIDDLGAHTDSLLTLVFIGVIVGIYVAFGGAISSMFKNLLGKMNKR